MKRPKRLSRAFVLPVVARSPERLHQIAQHCRYLAKTCGDEKAADEFLAMARDFDREAGEEEDRKVPIGSGRV